MLNSIDPARYLDIINGEKKFLFEKYFALLTEYNARFNLTAITERADIFEKHFLDSVTGETFFPKNANVLEVGSGAGFPSLPLKILREDLSFTLVESTGKKCEFLKVAAKELSLSDVFILNERAETLAHDLKYREKFDICCARAVARLNTLSEYCMPFVKIGGSFIAYKSDAGEELDEAENAIRKLGGKVLRVSRCTLPNYGVRTLIEIQKVKQTPSLYPRGQGKERKNPL